MKLKWKILCLSFTSNAFLVVQIWKITRSYKNSARAKEAKELQFLLRVSDRKQCLQVRHDFSSTDEAPRTKKGHSVCILLFPLLCGSLEAGAQGGTGLFQATGTAQCAPKPHLLSGSDLAPGESTAYYLFLSSLCWLLNIILFKSSLYWNKYIPFGLCHEFHLE